MIRIQPGIEVDSDNGPFVTQAFNEMAAGRWTLEEWADHAYSLGYRSRNGNRIGKQAWSGIFHHRFYIGETWLKKDDVTIKGNHEPLVDEATFVQVQEVLRQHDKYKQRVQRHKYLLRGLVYSLDADSPCWAETHPRKKISYYRSRARADENHVFYNTRDIEEQLPTIFRDITITEDARQQLRKELADWFDTEDDTNEELRKAEARLNKLERMERNLQQLVIEEEISFKDFKEHRSRIEAERARLNNTVDAIKQRQHLVKADFEIALHLATQLDFLYDKGNFDERRLLCETVLKRLYVKEGKVEKAELNSPFALIASRGGGSESVKHGGRYWT
jgi:site-specific DNA recombinase